MPRPQVQTKNPGNPNSTKSRNSQKILRACRVSAGVHRRASIGLSYLDWPQTRALVPGFSGGPNGAPSVAVGISVAGARFRSPVMTRKSRNPESAKCRNLQKILRGHRAPAGLFRGSQVACYTAALAPRSGVFSVGRQDPKSSAPRGGDPRRRGPISEAGNRGRGTFREILKIRNSRKTRNLRRRLQMIERPPPELLASNRIFLRAAPDPLARIS